MSENTEGLSTGGPDAKPESAEEAAKKARRAQHDHDDARVDEWEEESFPASDPPSNY
ncbi:MAG: hypothetical protein ACTHWW_00220 [Arthrobacter sp.]|uniref:hypothetical protein n=1 Tax=unclassified Arthrobacter TaxID=235627 RepID=UPI00265563BE|nr:hypothetical protein [Micrococcaceae bacterium]MDN5813811.1 hypothetical protein [Micrococcaceae bacterium]MDN5824799.1 hypothetical protein [Micrococcaceae bacterium]MDN5878618.1 hypothetical protein [Micrococcaceae bacterium]MDN5886179.1 hypothetical protein [Micrococcaceae bacterium]